MVEHVEEVKKECYHETATAAPNSENAASATKKPSEETRFTAPTEQRT